MKFILGVLTTLVVIVLVSATAFGIVPILSPLFGAGPKDLEIRITKEDARAAQIKDGTEIISLPPGTPISEDFKLEGKRPVDLTFDSNELTAHSNYRPWKNFPMKNLQIRILDNGIIESSGTLVISKGIPYAMGLGYSENEIRDAMQKYSIPPFEVPIFVRGKGSVINDAVTVNAYVVKIGFVTVPSAIVSQANKEAASVLNDVIKKHSNAFHVDSLTFDNGKMYFKGDLPVKEYVITE